MFFRLASLVLAALLFASFSSGAQAAKNEPITARVIGGTPAAENAYPWMIALLAKYNGKPTDEHICGASLISSQYALTAAHCVSGGGQALPAELFDVLIGQNRLSASTGLRVGLRGVAVHPKFNPDTLEYDFAILKLDIAVPYEPISIASPIEAFLYAAGTTAKVIGWGRTDPEYYVLPDKLQEANLPLVSDEICTDTSGNGRWVDPISMVCAGTKAPPGSNSFEPDSCNGDSGGPLVVQSGGIYKQVGTVSWGFACSSPRTYGVYGRVSSGYDFITVKPTFPPVPQFAIGPILSGAPTVGSVLSVTNGFWTGDPVAAYRYQWYQVGTEFDEFGSAIELPIVGATTSTFTVTADLAGLEVYAMVIATNEGGSEYALSNRVIIEVDRELAPTPTPAVIRGATAPIVKGGGKNCSKNSCTQYVVVDEGSTTTGVSNVRARLQITVPGKKKKGKKTKAKVTVSTVQGNKFATTGWSFKIPRIKNAKYRLYVTAEDSAGNLSRVIQFRYNKL